ncbi:MAG TPA: S53 family peptidase [Solirubrobacterales bacterium]|nr:S53 family peptidase [Solirubrobacterales bacterium]
MEPFLPSDIATYQDCYGTDVKITEVNVNGGPRPYEGEDGEAALDIEQLAVLAPGVEIIVYQGPNEGELPRFSAWVEQNVAKVMSSSWGKCEEKTPKAEMAAIGTLLQEAAAQGQSFFVAAGDTSSEDCYDADPSDKSISVDTPGSQPYATDVGGTQMVEPGTPPTEYLWNDGPEEGGGDGGVSEHFPMPAYQAEVAAGTGVVNALPTGSTCGFSGLCRQVPDVSAKASPETSYIFFSEEDWQLVGGTSAAAPLWAALAALTNASPACQGHTIGFANPALDRIAGNAYGANFHDITAGLQGRPPDQRHPLRRHEAVPGDDRVRHGNRARHPNRSHASRLALRLRHLAPARRRRPVGRTAADEAAPAPRRALRPRPRPAEAELLVGCALGYRAALGGGEAPPGGISLADSPADLAAGTVVFGAGHNRVRTEVRARGRGRGLMIRFAKPLPSGQFILRPPALDASPTLVARARAGHTPDLRLVVATEESGGRGAHFALDLRG